MALACGELPQMSHLACGRCAAATSPSPPLVRGMQEGDRLGRGEAPPILVVPWEGVTLVGTTDVDHQAPLDRGSAASAEEVRYLTAAVDAGRAITSRYLHVFKEGERVVQLSPIVPDRPTNLRLARKGDRVAAVYSQDGGKTWREFPQQTIDLPFEVKAGISTLNSTVRENTVQFEELKIEK